MNNDEYKISAKQIKMLQTLYHRAGMDEETRRDMLYNLTNGRTDSTKELTAFEAKTLISRLVPKAQESDQEHLDASTGAIMNKFDKKNDPANTKPEDHPLATQFDNKNRLCLKIDYSKPWAERYDQLMGFPSNEEEINAQAVIVLRAIYLLSLEISFLNKGYDSTDHDEIMINRAKLSKWTREKTVYKKNITQMTLYELQGVKKQLEAIAAKERKKEQMVTVNQ